MQTSVKIFILCLILCISLVTALQFGSKFVPLDQIISALMSMIDVNATASMTDTIITDIRLPRLIYSVLTGIGLSLVGLLMQTVTRNALADPYVLGVSSGASTGAVFAIIMGGLPFLGQYNTPIFAALGAALSIILVLLCVGKSNSPVKLILIGMGYDWCILSLNNDDYLRSQTRSSSAKCYVLATWQLCRHTME